MATPTRKTKDKAGEEAWEDKLKEDALKFKAVAKRKTPPPKIRQMSPRVYLAGQALSGLLARHQGPIRMEEIRREAFQWADFMLSDDFRQNILSEIMTTFPLGIFLEASNQDILIENIHTHRSKITLRSPGLLLKSNYPLIMVQCDNTETRNLR